MIERLEFGRTGHLSTRVVFGAAALGAVDQETADELLDVLRAHGVNHLDTAPSYGESELRLAPWLAGHRSDYFLATKTGERTGAGARTELERSLARLGVERVDLVQLHNLVEQDEWDTAHAAGGALSALVSARDEGLVRFIGVTGHGVRAARMHLRSLERFDYDSVLLPYNFTMLADSSYRQDVEELVEVCAARRVAVQTIKSVARGRWPDGAHAERRSWYEPVTEAAAIARAVHYVLGRPGLFLATSSDYRLLPAILAAARHRPAMPADDVMLSDAMRLGITRLFDGDALERM